MAKITKISKSPRLWAMAQECLPTGPVWDLCCDHGLLGRYHLAQGREVFFVDQAGHLLEQLQKRIGPHKLAHFLAQDARTLTAPLSGTLVLAGIGGHLMMKILDCLRPKLFGQWRLILCANRDSQQLQCYLELHFSLLQIVKKFSTLERGRQRQIVVVDALPI